MLFVIAYCEMLFILLLSLFRSCSPAHKHSEASRLLKTNDVNDDDDDYNEIGGTSRACVVSVCVAVISTSFNSQLQLQLQLQPALKSYL